MNPFTFVRTNNSVTYLLTMRDDHAEGKTKSGCCCQGTKKKQKTKNVFIDRVHEIAVSVSDASAFSAYIHITKARFLKQT